MTNWEEGTKNVIVSLIAGQTRSILTLIAVQKIRQYCLPLHTKDPQYEDKLPDVTFKNNVVKLQRRTSATELITVLHGITLSSLVLGGR
jgi:hypothetical protein